MVTMNYRNAYKEVDTILNCLSEEEYNKIPSEVIEAIQSNMNEDYEYFIDEDLDLSEQDMLPETKATLYNLFRDYLATPEQREKILKMQAEDRQKLEMQKKEIYNIKNVFPERTNNDKSIDIENNSMVEVKQKGFIQRIIEKIKNILKK